MNVNVAALIGSEDVTKFNERLAATVLAEYAKTLGSGKGVTKLAADELTGDAAFYELQKQRGWKMFKGSPEMKLLEDFFNSAADKFLKAIGTNEAEIKARSKNLSIFASVSEAGVAELAKSHSGSVSFSFLFPFPFFFETHALRCVVLPNRW